MFFRYMYIDNDLKNPDVFNYVTISSGYFKPSLRVDQTSCDELLDKYSCLKHNFRLSIQI